METILKPYNTKAILRNLEIVFKSKDIEKLNKATYEFLHLISGFIAHYDINGFKHYYNDLRVLIEDLSRSSDLKNPEYYKEECFIKWYGLDYCNSKVEILKGIMNLCLKYGIETEKHFSILNRKDDITIIKNLMQKHNINTINL